MASDLCRRVRLHEHRYGRNVLLRRAANLVLSGGANNARMCLACDPVHDNVPIVDTTGEAAWVGRQGLSHAGPATLPTKHVSNPTLRVRFRAPQNTFWNKSGTFVWWAAQPRDLSDAWQPHPKPWEAYRATGGNVWPNSGVVKKVDGFINVSCLAPQSYLEEGLLSVRHMHFMAVVNGAIDTLQTMTVGVWPSHHLGKDFEVGHLKSATSHDGCCCVDPSKVQGVLQRGQRKDLYFRIDATGSNKTLWEGGNVFSVHHTKATDEELLKIGREIGTSPVVVYCAHPECTAASTLMSRLQHLGQCRNVFYMPAGFQGYQGWTTQ